MREGREYAGRACSPIIFQSNNIRKEQEEQARQVWQGREGGEGV